MTAPLRICFACFSYSERLPDEPRAFLEAVPLFDHLPAALADRGHQVTLVHLFPRSATFTSRGVDYRFVSSRPAVRRLSRVAGRLTGRPAALFEPGWRAAAAVRASSPSIVHYHDATLASSFAVLRRVLPKPRPPIVLHYHGGQPSTRRWLRAFHRRALYPATRLLVTALEQAAPFVHAGAVRADRVEMLVESSSPLSWRPRDSARRETGMHGDPVVLSAARLHPNKDPLTMLRGFDRLQAERPSARLFCYYLTDEMRPEIERHLASRPGLARRVELRGTVSEGEMEPVYNSADILLQASRSEVSGYTVLHSLACGTTPVVTDIPAFRTLTDHGRAGALFPVGDSDALARAAGRVLETDPLERSRSIRDSFERRLGFPAMAARLEQIYSEILTAGSSS